MEIDKQIRLIPKSIKIYNDSPTLSHPHPYSGDTIRTAFSARKTCTRRREGKRGMDKVMDNHFHDLPVYERRSLMKAPCPSVFVS